MGLREVQTYLTISSSGGATASETINIPNQGILFSDGVLVTATTAGNIPSLTIFYEAKVAEKKKRHGN